MSISAPSGSKPLVCLLQASSEADRYGQALRALGCRTMVVPVLTFEWINADALRDRIGYPERYDGLILTSPRAARALEEAFRTHPQAKQGWQQKPTFVVGARTAEAAHLLGLATTGEQTGTAGKLADWIAQRSYRAPLLFLCGNRRRDVLPKALQRQGIALEELHVYETHSRQQVDWAALAEPDWVVFFSPSGVQAAQSLLREKGNRLRIAAIGPTTATALTDQGLTVAAIAEEPTPEGLAHALSAVSSLK